MEATHGGLDRPILLHGRMVCICLKMSDVSYSLTRCPTGEFFLFFLPPLHLTISKLHQLTNRCTKKESPSKAMSRLRDIRSSINLIRSLLEPPNGQLDGFGVCKRVICFVYDRRVVSRVVWFHKVVTNRGEERNREFGG